ncbi:hypothetical protein [Prevotella pallens]
MFRGYFVGVRHVIADRQQHYRKPLAAVGADLSCPHILKHPRNGVRKCVFDGTNVGIL